MCRMKKRRNNVQRRSLYSGKNKKAIISIALLIFLLLSLLPFASAMGSNLQVVPLGEEFSVSTMTELTGAIESAPAGVQRVILLENDLTMTGGTLTLPAGSMISLGSIQGESFTLLRTTGGRHFHVPLGSSLELLNITISGSYPTVSIEHGGISVNGDLFMGPGGAIINNHALNAAGVDLTSGGNFTMTGGEIAGNVALNGGGGVRVAAGSLFEMSDGIIRDNEAHSFYGGAGVNVFGGAFSMSGGIITENTAFDDGRSYAGVGGGVAIHNQGRGPDGIFTMSQDALIYNNHAANGGGVGVCYESTLMMEGGSILENTAEEEGGGVFVSQGQLQMIEGVIEGNTAARGGGVSMFYQSYFAMRGGIILENTATENGGGVWLWGESSFNMHYEATIEGNRAINGGAVYLNGENYPGLSYLANSSFTLDSGTIRANTAQENGGGVFVRRGNNFQNNGDIIGNTAQEGNGGGIYMEAGATLDAYAGAITNNHAAGDGGGIFTESYVYEPTLEDPSAYEDLYIHEDVVFADNTAGNGASLPPTNPQVTGIYFPLSGPSLGVPGLLTDPQQLHSLNNYDINFFIATPGIDISKTVQPLSVTAGGSVAARTVTYTLLIENTGSVDLLDLVVTDNLPDSLTSHTVLTLPQGVNETSTGSHLSFQINTLAPGENVTLVIEAVVGATVKGDSQIVNSAYVSSVEHALEANSSATLSVKTSGGGNVLPPQPPVGWRHAYLIGSDQGLILPQANITRAEVATIFFRLMEDETRAQYWSQTNSFSDVSAEKWFNNAISTTENMGLFQGINEEEFAPYQNMTRGELAVVLVRFMEAGSLGPFATLEQEDYFNDISGHWAQYEINRAAAEGWIRGLEGFGGPFYPDRPVTRAETAAMINRIFQRLPATVYDLLPDMVTWPDNPAPAVGKEPSWYYLYIQAASNSYGFRLKGDGIHEYWVSLTTPRHWEVLERPNSRPEDILEY